MGRSDPVQGGTGARLMALGESGTAAQRHSTGRTRRFVNEQSGHVLEKTTQYVGSTLELINGLSAADALTYLK